MGKSGAANCFMLCEPAAGLLNSAEYPQFVQLLNISINETLNTGRAQG